MSSVDKKKRNWKKFLLEELVEFWVNVIYLALVFAAFTQYRSNIWLPTTSRTRITGLP